MLSGQSINKLYFIGVHKIGITTISTYLDTDGRMHHAHRHLNVHSSNVKYSNCVFTQIFKSIKSSQPPSSLHLLDYCCWKDFYDGRTDGDVIQVKFHDRPKTKDTISWYANYTHSQWSSSLELFHSLSIFIFITSLLQRREASRWAFGEKERSLCHANKLDSNQPTMSQCSLLFLPKDGRASKQSSNKPKVMKRNPLSLNYLRVGFSPHFESTYWNNQLHHHNHHHYIICCYSAT